MASKGMGPELVSVLNASLKDSSYDVQATAIGLMTFVDPLRAVAMADSLGDTRSAGLKYVASAILMASRNTQYTSRILRNVRTIKDSQEKYQLITDLAVYLAALPAEKQPEGIALLMELCAKGEQWWIRYAAADGLSKFANAPGVKALVEERLKAETNEEVRQLLKAIK
jgi:sulfur transfer protein SufE